MPIFIVKNILPLEKQERPACFQITTSNPEGKKEVEKLDHCR
jgi:hypothetical protein